MAMQSKRRQKYNIEESELAPQAYKGLTQVVSHTSLISERKLFAYSPEEVLDVYRPNAHATSQQSGSKEPRPKRKIDPIDLMAIPTCLATVGLKVTLPVDNEGKGFWVVVSNESGVIVLQKGKLTREVMSSRKGKSLFFVVPNEQIVKKYNRMVRKGKLA